MRRWARLLSLISVVAVSGCRDDSVGATGTDDAGGTDTEDGTAGGPDGDPTADSDGPGPDTPCDDPAECEDDDPCTASTCGDDGTCEFTPVLVNECRPEIEVDFPPRAATIDGNSPGVVVTGTVRSAAGDITSLTINGEEVAFGSDGSFNHEVTAVQGGNTLILETTDELEQPRRRVQSFLWSPEYAKPEAPMSGLSGNGLGIFLAQEVIDDGDRGEPIDDLASILQLALGSFDLGALFSADTVVASTAGYNVYLTDLSITGTDVALSAIDDGLHVDASLNGIVGDLDFICDGWECELAGGSGTGGLSIATVRLVGDLRLSIEDDHTIDINLVNVQTFIDPDDVNVWADSWWTDVVIGVVEFFVLENLVADIAAQLNSSVQDVLGPLLADGLDQFNLNTSLELPNLADADTPIVVDLITDFGDRDFHDGDTPPNPSPPQGGLLVLRGGGFAETETTPYDNLGIPLREGCGEGGDGMHMPRASLMEIGLHDDLLNQILYGAWRGGLLEFPLTDELLGGGGGGGGLYEDLDVDISGMLAPTASDCGEGGTLLAHIGDIRIDASLTLLDEPVTFVAFSSMVVGLEVSDLDGALGITITGVESIETELTVGEDAAIELEPALIDAIESQLGDGLIGALGGGALGAIELPEMDLSGALGLDPGTALIAITVDDVSREDGTTVISGRL